MHAILLDLIEDRAIAYSEQPGGGFPIPPGFLECARNGISLRFRFNALDERLQRLR